MDRGATVLRQGPFGAGSATWAPFAGCRPRVLAYAEAAEAIIHAAVVADAEWGADIVAKFDKLAIDEALPTGEGSQAAIVIALVSELEQEYDLRPPETAKDFRKLAIGAEFDPEGYLARAMAKVGEDMAEEALRHELTAVGAPRVPYAGLVRETRLTQMRRSLDSAQILWKQLRDAFHGIPDAFDLPPAQKKATLISGLRRIAEISLHNTPVVVSPPSLKLFAASRWLPRRTRVGQPVTKK